MDEYVEMTGTGSVSGVPDVVRLSLQVQHSADTVAMALDGCAAAAVGVIAALDRAGIEAPDRQTTSLGVETGWDQRGQRPKGYHASQGISVRLRDTAQVGEVVGAAADAAGDDFRLHGLVWQVADPAALEEQARDAAWHDALTRATQVARLSGRTLGRVLQIDEGAATALFPRPSMRAYAMAASEQEMPTEAGTQGVEVTLRVRWAFDPALGS
ncbi:MAG: uncharacterized protein QOH37_3517 [Nocardioidaceae bacterium]|jgi:uncharacterized protein YggE|nr:uncharacterized protein [Nocardioidaceae bacterium]